MAIISLLVRITKKRSMFHRIIAISIVCLIACLPPVHKFTVVVRFLIYIFIYIDVPSYLLITSLRHLPFVLGDMRYCFQLLIYLRGQVGLLHLIIQLLFNINAIDSSPLVFVFHEEERVVIRFFGIRIHLFRLIYFEVFIDMLMCMLFL